MPLVGAAVAAAALSGGEGDRAPRASAGPVRGLTASLQDEVRRLPRDRIAWTTRWRLCWNAYAGARAYELRPLTGEGAPATSQRQRGRCFAIEVAKGRNARSAGLVRRDVQVALQQSQLAYQVRAVVSGGRTPWSRSVPVGEPFAGR